jgi:ribonuclease BN (tRNA processing enzyme)
MSKPAALDPGMLAPGNFVQEALAHPEALIYFCCNVGDADAQVILLPEYGVPPKRQVIIVDVGVTSKVPNLLDEVETAGIVDLQSSPDDPIALVVTTHPHQDHIGGLPELLRTFGDRTAEYWDSGYFHPIPAYHQAMAEVERLSHLLYSQPTSGLRRFIGDVAITALSPSIQLRNRFDSYGTEINDASISLRLEFPVHRYLEDRPAQGQPITAPRTRSLLLGGDAQTTSWAFVLVDFPFLRKSETPAAKAIAAAQANIDLLKADIFKVSHHGSKHGVNLELIERIDSKATLISSVDGRGKYRFPHTVAQDVIREGLHPTAQSGASHPPDADIGIFYTADATTQSTKLGTIGLIVRTGSCSMWRFGDEPADPVVLTNALRWAKDVW